MHSTTSRPLRVLSNTSWLHGRRVAGRTAESVALRDRSWPVNLWRIATGRYDAAMLNIDARSLLVMCAAKKLLPFSHFKILSLDLILTRPRGLAGYVQFWIRRWLLREVDRFLLYYRDTEALRRVYGIPEERVRYVPFKVNTRDRVLAAEARDEGYFLACGRSNRDYRTLARAFRELPYECRILAPWAEAEAHGTRLDGAALPPNVKLVSDDGSPDSWNAWIAGARAVILPIEPGKLSPSGIGTYLVAMAMGKCVVITESPATAHILDDSTAVLVPPNDAEALRAAVARVAEDAEFRDRVAEGGRRYALSLGGEERLVDDVVHQMSDLLTSPPGAYAGAAARPG